MTPYQGDPREVHDDAQSLRERLVPKKDGDMPNEPLRQALTLIANLAKTVRRLEEDANRKAPLPNGMSGVEGRTGPICELGLPEGHAGHCSWAGHGTDTDKTRLEMKLLNSLVQIEWTKWTIGSEKACPACRRGYVNGYNLNGTHLIGCVLDAALTSAGLPDQSTRNAAREKK